MHGISSWFWVFKYQLISVEVLAQDNYLNEMKEFEMT